MEQRVCDRCGKILHNNYYACKIEQNSFLMFCNKNYEFDLCDDCQKDFMKFLSKGNEAIWFDIQEKEPDDHFFVLVAHADFETPMKAKFHVGEGFEVIGHDFVCLDDDRIKYWTYLPNMPIESEGENDG